MHGKAINNIDNEARQTEDLLSGSASGTAPSQRPRETATSESRPLAGAAFVVNGGVWTNAIVFAAGILVGAASPPKSQSHDDVEAVEPRFVVELAERANDRLLSDIKRLFNAVAYGGCLAVFVLSRSPQLC